MKPPAIGWQPQSRFAAWALLRTSAQQAREGLAANTGRSPVQSGELHCCHHLLNSDRAVYIGVVRQKAITAEP